VSKYQQFHAAWGGRPVFMSLNKLTTQLSGKGHS
jgi:hypothetical protein